MNFYLFLFVTWFLCILNKYLLFWQEEDLKRPLDPEELFLATHKRKSGEWVDSGSEGTYDSYRNRLSQIVSSTNGGQEVDETTKLELWKEIAGGQTRGRCYGTADFSLNIRRGISSLTQESPTPPSCNSRFEGNERAARAEERAARAEACYDNLEDQVRTMMQHMAALERQSGSASCGASQSRRHHDYDDDLDDHSMDEASPAGRHPRLLISYFTMFRYFPSTLMLTLVVFVLCIVLFSCGTSNKMDI